MKRLVARYFEDGGGNYTIWRDSDLYESPEGNLVWYSEAQHENATLTARAEAAEAERDKQAANNAALRSLNDKLELEVHRARDKLTKTQAMLALANESTQRQSVELHAERTAHAQTREELEGALSLVSTCQKRMGELESEVKLAWEEDPLVPELRTAHAQTREELAELKRTLPKQHAYQLELQQTLGKARADLATAQARVAELELKLEDAERGERDAVKACDDNWVTHRRVVAAESALASANARLEAGAKALRSMYVMNSRDSGQVVCASSVEGIADEMMSGTPTPEPPALTEARLTLLSARPHCAYTSVEADIDEWIAKYPEPKP